MIPLRTLPASYVSTLALIYDDETWVLRKADKRKMETLQMKLLRSAIGVTLRYKIKSDKIGELGNKRHSGGHTEMSKQLV
jgi:hypothetical protein